MPYRSVFQDQLFANQTMVITGGGSGIGRCTAHELASLGAKVILVGRQQEKLDTVSAEIKADGGQVASYSLDIRDEDRVIATIAQMLDDHGPIHGLLNNAGGQFPAPLADISQNGFETVVRTNLTGGFLMARELYKQCFSKQRFGNIVNIVADMWGGMPNMGHSGAARAGMVNFTETAAVEWARHAVRVNAVAPGWIASSGLDTYTNPMIVKMLPKVRQEVPLKRLATEAEVSAAICFLLSEGAAFITGTCIKVDGGAPLNSRMYPLKDHNYSKPFNGFHLYKRPKVLDAED